MVIKISNLPPQLKYISQHLLKHNRQVLGIKCNIDMKEDETNVQHNEILNHLIKNWCKTENFTYF